MCTHRLAITLLLVAGCGGGPPQYKVKDKTLLVKEQNYGQDGSLFCDNLDPRGQFMVILTDFKLCDSIKVDGGSKSAIHGAETANLRMVFPSTLTVVPKVNTFKVGQSDCQTLKNPDDTQAIAFFSHNDPGTGRYDVNAPATGGTISVTDYNKDANSLKGTFDLSFDAEKLTGSFDALFCNAVLRGTGN